MMQQMNPCTGSSRYTDEQMNRTAERAARFFTALHVFFFGWWSWRGSLSVCKNC